jgi:hypothetical protein
MVIPEGVKPEEKSTCPEKELDVIAPGMLVFLNMEIVDPD